VSTKVDKGDKYRRRIRRGKDGKSDIYDIIDAFELDGALSHALKKILCPGERGTKDFETDLREAQWSIERSIENSKPESETAASRH
jgi:hypothetical protein